MQASIRRQLSDLQARAQVLMYDAESDRELEAFIVQRSEKLREFCSDLPQISSIAEARHACRTDLFFLIAGICNRDDMLNAWCYERCHDVQRESNNILELWSRGHYKSTIGTFGKTLQDIIVSHGTNGTGEELTCGIFSVTRVIAKAFLRQLKAEMERNDNLKLLFSDIFYDNPAMDSPKWSEDTGLIVKRKDNKKEATVEAWGLIEGQPTSKHFDRLVYDDIITHDTAKTKYSMQMALNSFENSLSLCSMKYERRFYGTRKHLADVYSTIIERGIASPRIYTCYDQPRLKSDEEIKKMEREMGKVTFSAECLQDPLKDSSLGFDINNLQTHNVQNYDNMRLYIFCDPASSVKKGSDYTAMCVFGIDENDNVLLIDGVRDRMRLSRKFDELHNLHSKYPIRRIFYEQTGLASDIQSFRDRMDEIGYYFSNDIEEINPRRWGKKEDRINRIQPFLDNGKIFFPRSLPNKSSDGAYYDLVNVFKLDELHKFPFPEHDDLLDCLAYAIIYLTEGIITSVKRGEQANVSSYYDLVNQQVGLHNAF